MGIRHKAYHVLLFMSVMGGMVTPLLMPYDMLNVQAQIASPITSSGLNTKISEGIDQGEGVTQYDITGGTRVGPNNFYRFGEFNVPENNIANFLNDSRLPTSNLIGGVTDGIPSHIFGAVQTEGFGNANLFLLNPAGIVFGPNATLNIGGDAHFTTADFLRLSDDVQFTALPSAQDAVLSSAPVVSFGFLNPSPAGISVDGSHLSVEQGRSISFVGGDISVTGGTLKAPSGEIHIVSVASSGEVNLSTFGEPSAPQVDSFDGLGVVEVSEDASLNTSGVSGGSVIIRSGVLVVDSAHAEASGVGEGEAGGTIHLLGDEEVSLIGNTSIVASGDAGGGTILVGGNVGGQGPESNATKTFIGPNTTITADAIREGIGGKVVVWADETTEFMGNIHARGGIEAGKGGFVETSGKDVLHVSGFVDVSAPKGSGGAWLLDPANITIQSEAGSIVPNGDTFTGDIVDSTVMNTSIEAALNAGNGVEVIISTNTELGIDNQAGNIIQNADAAIEKTAGTNATLTLNAANDIELNGGISSTMGLLNVALNANDATQAAHDLNTNSGDVTINAAIDTHGGDFSSTGVNFTAMANSSINTNGSDSGNVHITATDTVTLDNTTIVTSASGFDTPGSVMIHSHDMVMNNSTISADTENANGPDTAIDIDLSGDFTISTVDNAALTARTTGFGNAGDIGIHSSGMSVNAAPIGNFFFSMIDTHTSGFGNAGNVSITTGDLLVQGNRSNFNFFIDSGNNGFFAGAGGNVEITADSFEAHDTWISTGNLLSVFFFGAARTAGDVTIKTDNLALTNTVISAEETSFLTPTAGIAGNITIDKRTNLPDITLINSTIDSIGGEQGGAITIHANRLFADDSGISNQTNSQPGGSINITGTDIQFVNGSSIVSSTVGDGHAGSITVTASERLGLLGHNLANAPSGIFSNSTGSVGSLGNAGDIVITTPILEMKGGGRVDTSTNTSGVGGNVTINTTQLLSITGETAAPPLEDLFTLGANEGSGIYTQSIGGNCTGPCGDAGNIIVNTGSMEMESGAQINSGTSNTGRGGGITVTATNDISISGTLTDGTPAGIRSRTTGPLVGAGSGGNLTLVAGDSFQLDGGASLSTDSTGAGTPGNINVTTLNGDVQLNNGIVEASSTTQATSGDIHINAGQNAEFTNNSTVSALNTGTGDAGGIFVGAGDTVLVQDSTFNVQSAQGNAGDIKFDADFMIHVVNSVISGSTGGGPGTQGANINFDPQWIIIENSQILASAFEGQGGNVTLIADNGVFIDTATTIDFSSTFGTSGSLDVQAPIQNLSSVVTPLPQGTLKVAKMYAARCAAQKGGRFSSFVQGGRDGMPPSPGGFMSSPLTMSAPGSQVGSSSPIPGTSRNMVKRLGLNQDPDILGPYDSARWILGDTIKGCTA